MNEKKAFLLKIIFWCWNCILFREIKFRNAFCMKAVNEKCEKSFYDINIFEPKKGIFTEDNFLILDRHFFSWTEQWILASIFAHRVAQILCSANTQFLENTSEIKFRNAFCMQAVNEKCKKSFCAINIFERKNRIFAEDNF